MLDGILGRRFSVKCKSLIKTTRARIEVVRKRAEAKQRFLREDLAKLLSNGLDINAYGRTEEFVAGMNLLFCYDFVEQCCEHTAKQLSRMQKRGECPEECREAVACLMYAAARFSGLPELRELRDIFEQRYGNCLESAVNQKFVEKLSSRPPTSEKRLRVLQDIALDFSIKWDSRGFERRMAAPSAVAQGQVAVQKADAVKRGPGIVEERKSRIREGGEDDIISRRDEAHHSLALSKDRIGLTKSYPIEKSDSEPKVEKSTIGQHGKIFDYSNGIGYPSKGESEKEALFREKVELAPSHLQPPGRTENGISCYARPPPYVKSKDKNIPRPPYIKPNEDKYRDGEEDKHGNGRVSKHDQVDEQITDHEKETGAIPPSPRPRSIRKKKQHRLPNGSSFEEHGGGALSSRRKEHSRKGLQILFDEGPHTKGDEERMIDTLLMHYSKTSLSHEDDTSLRKKSPSQKLKPDFGESSARKKS